MSSRDSEPSNDMNEIETNEEREESTEVTIEYSVESLREDEIPETISIETAETEPQDAKMPEKRTLLNRLFPPLVPRYPIHKRLITNEVMVDESLTYHLSEIQMILGVIFLFVGGYLMVFYFYPGLLVLTVAVLLLITGFEVEEIIITTKRVIIRKVGVIERLLRIPVDEEHLLKHVVSYHIGRAPINMVMVFSSLSLLIISGFVQILANYPPLVFWGSLVGGFITLILGLRLWKRSLIIYFTGGNQLTLGLRKGVPYHILANFSNMVLNILSLEEATIELHMTNNNTPELVLEDEDSSNPHMT